MGADDPIAEVFIDESSQNNHTYFVMGGVIAPVDLVPTITAFLLKSRLPELPSGEMKWAKVSRSKLPAYKRYIDVFFECEHADAMDFHSLVVLTAKQDHARFNKGSRDIGFNKELFQLAMKFGRLYANRFHIYPDERTTTQKTDDLRLMLNRATNNREPSRDWPYRRVQFRDSAKTPILQLADIFSGALAYCLNGHDKTQGASPAKQELCSYIRDRAKIRDVLRDTSVKGKFTVWHRRLR
jgi:hypothetical protein